MDNYQNLELLLKEVQETDLEEVKENLDCSCTAGTDNPY